MTMRNILAWVLVLVVVPLHAVAADEIHVTEHFYAAASNHSKICKAWFGGTAIPLDFDDIKHISSSDITTWMGQHGIIPTRNEMYYFVTYNGLQMFPGDDKHAYFFEYQGGNPPAFFDAIETYQGANVAITNKYGKVVCKTITTASRKLTTTVREHHQHQQQQQQQVEELYKREMIQVNSGGQDPENTNTGRWLWGWF